MRPAFELSSGGSVWLSFEDDDCRSLIRMTIYKPQWILRILKNERWENCFLYFFSDFPHVFKVFVGILRRNERWRLLDTYWIKSTKIAELLEQIWEFFRISENNLLIINLEISWNFKCSKLIKINSIKNEKFKIKTCH